MQKNKLKTAIDLSIPTGRSILNKGEDVDSFLSQITKYKILTADEERDLFKKMRAGDERAKDKIAGSLQLFVYAIAKRYLKKGLDIMDLVMEGNIGLMESMEAYNINSGNRFISYAVWMITRRITNYVRDNRLIKGSTDLKYTPKIVKIRSKFLCENGREATDEEVLEILEKQYGITIKNVDNIQELTCMFLEGKVSMNEDSGELGDLPDVVEKTCSINDYEDEIEQEYMRAMVNTYLKKLGAKEQYALKHYYGIGCEAETLDIIAEDMGVCKERVRQLVASSVKEIRRMLNMKEKRGNLELSR